MVTLIQWGIGWHFTNGSFFFVPTLQYSWCPDCSCGKLIIRFIVGNFCIELRRDTFELSVERREENED